MFGTCFMLCRQCSYFRVLKAPKHILKVSLPKFPFIVGESVWSESRSSTNKKLEIPLLRRVTKVSMLHKLYISQEFIPFQLWKAFQNMSFFYFFGHTNTDNGKITRLNNISQAMSNLNLLNPKGPFRIVKGLIILKGISKMSLFSTF